MDVRDKKLKEKMEVATVLFKHLNPRKFFGPWSHLIQEQVLPWVGLGLALSHLS